MNADNLRSKQDVEISRQLMETKAVKRINEAIEKREEKGPMGTRRRLLATSVRISRNMAPWLHEMACLLYTSPSPRDATLSRMPSSA